MPFVGQIEPFSEATKIDPKGWLALIDSHDSLGHVPPRKSINPFTRQPMEVKAPASTAVVLIDGADVGSISWAMDGSPVLIVDAEDGSEEAVAKVAEEVAKALGARFVPE
jgi:hypothetical protein